MPARVVKNILQPCPRKQISASKKERLQQSLPSYKSFVQDYTLQCLLLCISVTQTDNLQYALSTTLCGMQFVVFSQTSGGAIKFTEDSEERLQRSAAYLLS